MTVAYAGGTGSAQPARPPREAPKVRTFVVSNELDRARMLAWAQKAALRDADGQPMLWVAKRRKLKRSLPQNALFHAWVHILAVYTGETDAKMKDDLKRHLLPLVEVVSRVTGEIRMEPTPTRGLNKQDFAEFMTRLQALAVDLFGITLPTPDDPASWEAFEEFKALAEAA